MLNHTKLQVFNQSFYNMRCFVMFITAVYILSLRLRYYEKKKKTTISLLIKQQAKKTNEINKSRVYKTELKNIQ